MIITEISPYKKNKQKVYINNQYAFLLYSSEIERFKLKNNSEITEECYSQINSILIQRIKDRIMYLITDYDRSECEIRARIISDGYNRELADVAIEELKVSKIVDDERFCRYYIECMQRRGKSIYEIKNGLCRKGIDGNLLEKVFSETEIDDDEAICRFFKKKGIVADDIEYMDYKEKAALYRAMNRRGLRLKV